MSLIYSDGATASGLYLALTFVIDKMKLEQECDVCQAVRSIRHFRNQFVRNCVSIQIDLAIDEISVHNEGVHHITNWSSTQFDLKICNVVFTILLYL